MMGDEKNILKIRKSILHLRYPTQRTVLMKTATKLHEENYVQQLIRKSRRLMEEREKLEEDFITSTRFNFTPTKSKSTSSAKLQLTPAEQKSTTSAKSRLTPTKPKFTPAKPKLTPTPRSASELTSSSTKSEVKTIERQKHFFEKNPVIYKHHNQQQQRSNIGKLRYLKIMISPTENKYNSQ